MSLAKLSLEEKRRLYSILDSLYTDLAGIANRIAFFREADIEDVLQFLDIQQPPRMFHRNMVSEIERFGINHLKRFITALLSLSRLDEDKVFLEALLNNASTQDALKIPPKHTVAGKRIFISYSSKDRPIVALIAECLNKAGIDTWYDRDNDEPILGTESWEKRLREEIQKASHVLVYATENSLESKWVRAEIHYAEICGKTFLLAQDPKLDQELLPLHLVGLQAITINKNQPCTNEFLAAIRAALA